MISTDLLAETEAGADIGIAVCTSDHSIEAFAGIIQPELPSDQRRTRTTLELRAMATGAGTLVGLGAVSSLRSGVPARRSSARFEGRRARLPLKMERLKSTIEKLLSAFSCTSSSPHVGKSVSKIKGLREKPDLVRTGSEKILYW